jgi:hypothetical protein
MGLSCRMMASTANGTNKITAIDRNIQRAPLYERCQLARTALSPKTEHDSDIVKIMKDDLSHIAVPYSKK